jgi:hypothetical protein
VSKQFGAHHNKPSNENQKPQNTKNANLKQQSETILVIRNQNKSV